MSAGRLLDVDAGAPVGAVRAGPAGLGIERLDLTVAATQRRGPTVTAVWVVAPDERVHRDWAAVRVRAGPDGLFLARARRARARARARPSGARPRRGPGPPGRTDDVEFPDVGKRVGRNLVRVLVGTAAAGAPADTRRAAVLASSEPHLHLHVQDDPRLLAGTGQPMAFAGVAVNGRRVARAELRQGRFILAGR